VAIDIKYGQVTTEKGDIPDDEPVVVFRARDELLPKVLAYYHLFCLRDGSPRHHLDGVLEAREVVMEWQSMNDTKIPTSDSLRGS
jgi:hypothetical protein